MRSVDHSIGNVRPKLSIIVPFYNEEENIGRMHAALVDAVAHIGVSYELVFVDDGSADQTFLIAARIAERDVPREQNQLKGRQRQPSRHTTQTESASR